jgi:hypothetical protein
MALAALSCVAGGWLLGPASAQPGPPTYCGDYVGRACSGTPRTMTCYYSGGGSAVIYCLNGTWVYV